MPHYTSGCGSVGWICFWGNDCGRMGRVRGWTSPPPSAGFAVCHLPRKRWRMKSGACGKQSSPAKRGRWPRSGRRGRVGSVRHDWRMTTHNYAMTPNDYRITSYNVCYTKLLRKPTICIPNDPTAALPTPRIAALRPGLSPPAVKMPIYFVIVYSFLLIFP